MEVFYDLQQICLIPTQINGGNEIERRMDLSVIDSFDRTGANPRSYPIFTSPMDSVVDKETSKMYVSNNIKPVLPLTESIEVRLEMCQWIFCSFTMEEVEKLFATTKRICQNQLHVCIETPNPHSVDLLRLCRRLREYYGTNGMLIMVGPVGNGEIILEYARLGINYMRVGMQNGSLADPRLYGFHYPSASLLENIERIKKTSGVGISRFPKVILDGGITCQSDIIKAIALGADYVMIGREFAECIEAAGPIFARVKNKDTGKLENIQVPVEELAGADPVKAKVNGWKRRYYPSSSPEIRAKVLGFSSTEEYMKARDMGLRVHLANKELNVDKSINEWLVNFENCARYAFLMTGTTCWSDYKLRVRYAVNSEW